MVPRDELLHQLLQHREKALFARANDMFKTPADVFDDAATTAVPLERRRRRKGDDWKCDGGECDGRKEGR